MEPSSSPNPNLYANAAQPSTAMIPAEGETQSRPPTYSVILPDMWRIIFEYANSSRDVASTIYPHLGRIIDRSNIVVLRNSLAGSTAFINLLADSLDQKKYPEQVKELKALAERYSTLENPEKTDFDPTYMLATVYAQADRLRKDLVTILLAVKPEDCENLKKTIEAKLTAEQLKHPSFFHNIFAIVQNQQLWDKSKENSLEDLFNLFILSGQDATLNPIIYERIETLQMTQSQRDHLYSEALNRLKPEEAFDFIRQSGNSWSVNEKIRLAGKVVDNILKAGNPIAWELLMPRKAENVTSEERESAKKDLEAIKSLLTQGQLLRAFELVGQRITDIDPSTKALKFPDLCFQCLELLLALPKEQLAQLAPPSEAIVTAQPDEKDKKSSDEITGTAAQPAKAKQKKELSKPLMNILEFMITQLPDGSRKEDLLFKANESGLFSPAKDILLATLTELKKRDSRLLKLARIFINEREPKLAFEVINQIQSPCFIFGFINSLLVDSGIKLTAEQNTALQNIIHNLPNTLKYLLILQNKEKPNPLLAQLAKEFDVTTLKEEAEKQICLVIMAKKIQDYFVAKKELSEEDKNRLFLLFSRMTENNRNELQYALAVADHHSVLKELANYTSAIGRSYRFLSEEHMKSWISQIRGLVKHPFFMLELVKSTKESATRLSAELEKEISEMDRKQLATVDEDYRTLTIVSEGNPLLTEVDIAQVISSDLLLHGYVYMQLQAYNHDELKDSGVFELKEKYIDSTINTWLEQGFGADFKSHRF